YIWRGSFIFAACFETCSVYLAPTLSVHCTGELGAALAGVSSEAIWIADWAGAGVAAGAVWGNEKGQVLRREPGQSRLYPPGSFLYCPVEDIERPYL
ncbi:MAG: hypothetical protein NT154_16085, partial [Verrucomicrobia bacterium]|nr:hypothetical protein [Verrucomicrobiota bacterium]